MKSSLFALAVIFGCTFSQATNSQPAQSSRAEQVFRILQKEGLKSTRQADLIVQDATKVTCGKYTNPSQGTGDFETKSACLIVVQNGKSMQLNRGTSVKLTALLSNGYVDKSGDGHAQDFTMSVQCSYSKNGVDVHGTEMYGCDLNREETLYK